ncbi:hypothetical protein J7F01_18460 [Streptomyces sp. ISL-22]|uniref:hypothetical protein n=1 Tax=unclassified Streptomyces TaxID=2593676 RepID=UPI001BE807ED|nr:MULTISPECIES: hypothetical protein [unclassified Streptomyces]MBT2423140.1 hypothetical protein [Streptomyces sp. ISL-24]MBT2434125.1 hypothetical protein [Streptomyces sp. ISL-22]
MKEHSGGTAAKKNKDATRLTELRGIAYEAALRKLREENERHGDETLHATGLRMIAEAEAATGTPPEGGVRPAG